MRGTLEVLCRAAIDLVIFLAGLAISLAALAFCIVGLFGTGAFTADPPPEQPAYLFVAVVVIGWAGLMVLLSRLRHRIGRASDERDLC